MEGCLCKGRSRPRRQPEVQCKHLYGIKWRVSRVRRREPRAKSIGDINEQAGRMLTSANAARTRMIQRISETYRNNIKSRLGIGEVMDYERGANIRVSYGARIGDRFASLASKGNSNS